MSAIRIDASADVYSRASNLPTGDFTLAGWFYQSVDRNTFGAIFGLDNNNSAGERGYMLGISGDGTSLQCFNFTDGGFGFSSTIVNMSLATWYYGAIVLSSTTLTGYVKTAAGAFATQANTQAGVFTRTHIHLGRTHISSEIFNGRLAAVKLWDAALTANELLMESMQHQPKRWANLNAFWPLISPDNDEKDYGPNGRDLTAGTATFEDGPPIRWGRSATRVMRYTPPVVGGSAFPATHYAMQWRHR